MEIISDERSKWQLVRYSFSAAQCEPLLALRVYNFSKADIFPVHANCDPLSNISLFNLPSVRSTIYKLLPAQYFRSNWLTDLRLLITINRPSFYKQVYAWAFLGYQLILVSYPERINNSYIGVMSKMFRMYWLCWNYTHTLSFWKSAVWEYSIKLNISIVDLSSK